MTPPNTEALIAKGLTPSMRQALTDFEPGVWYGEACPNRRAAAHKGHAVRMGLLQHDAEAPVSHYSLTPLGLAVRQYILEHPHD